MITRQSFSYAVRGLSYVLSSERNARFHLLVATIVVLFSVSLSLFFPELALSSEEFAAVIFAIFLVFLAEIVNSAFETVLDLLRPNPKHPATGVVKDMAAGAVLVASIGSVLIGIIVFLPRVIALWSLAFGV